MPKSIFKVVPVLLVLLYPVNVLAEYIFTAPPRETEEQGNELYKPIADFLSRKTGETFVYKHPESWEAYGRGMKNKEYDLVFDGPHFVSWRIEFIQHDVIVKLPQLQIWRVVVSKDNDTVRSLDDLVGQKICAPKSPNFGMLTMMSHYPNPDKEPVHVITKGWKDGYNGVVDGKCMAAVIPLTNHKKFDPREEKTKSIHTHLPYPNQAFTTASSITPSLKEKIIAELLSEQGQNAMTRLRERFTRGAELVGAENEEYEGISMVLKRADNFGSSTK